MTQTAPEINIVVKEGLVPGSCFSNLWCFEQDTIFCRGMNWGMKTFWLIRNLFDTYFKYLQRISIVTFFPWLSKMWEKRSPRPCCNRCFEPPTACEGLWSSYFTRFSTILFTHFNFMPPQMIVEESLLFSLASLTSPCSFRSSPGTSRRSRFDKTSKTTNFTSEVPNPSCFIEYRWTMSNLVKCHISIQIWLESTTGIASRRTNKQTTIINKIKIKKQIFGFFF